MRDLPPELLARPFTIEMAAIWGVERWHLRSRRVRRLLRNVFIGSHVLLTVDVLSAAVALVLPEGATVSKSTAALLRGADIRTPGDLDIDVTVLRESRLRRHGVRSCESYLEPGDVGLLNGIPVTSAVRTAFDLARERNLIERVVGVDAMLNRGGCSLAELAAYIDDRPAWWGVRWAREALIYAEPKAESPQETRQRMHLVLAGLPRPEAQYVIWTPDGEYRLDHAYDEFKVSPEYDGKHHEGQWKYDLERHEYLDKRGWWHRRYTSVSIRGGWGKMVDEVGNALVERGWNP